MDTKFKKQLQNSIKNRRLYIGGSMVLDPDFDIKNYLSDIQKQVQLEKMNFNSKNTLPPIKLNPNELIIDNNSSNFNTINYDKEIKPRKIHKYIFKKPTDENKPLVTLNNLLSLSKKNRFNNNNISKIKRVNTIDTDLNIQKKLLEANNSILSTKNKIEKIIKKIRIVQEVLIQFFTIEIMICLL